MPEIEKKKAQLFKNCQNLVFVAYMFRDMGVWSCPIFLFLPIWANRLAPARTTTPYLRTSSKNILEDCQEVHEKWQSITTKLMEKTNTVSFGTSSWSIKFLYSSQSNLNSHRSSIAGNVSCNTVSSCFTVENSAEESAERNLRSLTLVTKDKMLKKKRCFKKKVY